METTQVTFEGIRTEIEKYLSTKDEFKSYNFKGTVLSMLIDALAYTSHYLIRYANFSLNECFLNSAKLRHNVVSNAKEIGYIPYQYTASKVILRLHLKSNVLNDESNTSLIILPKNSSFNSISENNESFKFISTDDCYFMYDEKYISQYGTGYYLDVNLIQGIYVTEEFYQDETYLNRFYLANNDVDTEYIEVIVYNTTDDISGEKYTRASSLSDFGSDSPLFYIEEAYNGSLEIYFGDGKLSKRPPEYSRIQVTYLVTTGAKANNIKNFTLEETIKNVENNSERYYIGDNSFTIEVVEQSSGGSPRESIDDIKFNAPKFFQAQDRAVTTRDYNALIKNKFGNIIDSITSWGGEEDDEIPRYATVYTSIKPSNNLVTTLSKLQKEEIINYISSKNMPCIDLQIVDPNYINVNMSFDIDWEFHKTTKQMVDIKKSIITEIENYFKVDIPHFNETFKYSKLLERITNVDSSVDSIQSNISLEQYISPNIKIEKNYVIDFCNRIQEGNVYIGNWNTILVKCIKDEIGKSFTITEENISLLNGYAIEGDIVGKLYEYKEGIKTVLAGYVNYTQGIIFLKNYLFTFTGLASSSIPVLVYPYFSNIEVKKNYLLKINEKKFTVNLIVKK